MGPATRASPRLAHDVVERDVHAEPPQPADHLLGAAAASGAGLDEKRLEPWLARREEVAEHVQLAPPRLHTELAARHDAAIPGLTRPRGIRHALRCFAVGH